MSAANRNPAEWTTVSIRRTTLDALRARGETIEHRARKEGYPCKMKPDDVIVNMLALAGGWEARLREEDGGGQ